MQNEAELTDRDKDRDKDSDRDRDRARRESESERELKPVKQKSLIFHFSSPHDRNGTLDRGRNIQRGVFVRSG